MPRYSPKVVNVGSLHQEFSELKEITTEEYGMAMKVWRETNKFLSKLELIISTIRMIHKDEERAKSRSDRLSHLSKVVNSKINALEKEEIQAYESLEEIKKKFEQLIQHMRELHYVESAMKRRCLG